MPAANPAPCPAPNSLRLGLRMIKGMRRNSAGRISDARKQGGFHDVHDLARRAHLDRHDLAVLADAAALRGLAGHRHRARWEVAAVEKPVDDLLNPTPPPANGAGGDGRSEPSGRDHEYPVCGPSGNRTFPAERIISEEAAAYSDLALLKDGTAGCLWERAGYRFITFTRFNLAFLEPEGPPTGQ